MTSTAWSIVGDVANLVSLAELGKNLSFATGKYLHEARNAEEHSSVLRMASSLDNFVELLEQVERGQTRNAEVWRRFLGIPGQQIGDIAGCKLLLAEVAEKLQPPRGAGQKLKWPLRVDEVKEILEGLDRYQRSFTLALVQDSNERLVETGQIFEENFKTLHAETTTVNSTLNTRFNNVDELLENGRKHYAENIVSLRRDNQDYHSVVLEGIQDIQKEIRDTFTCIVTETSAGTTSSGTTQTSIGSLQLNNKAERKHCPPPSRVFTGRADILTVINEYFSQSTNEQLAFVLYGLGGSGKSEIMRRFVADSQAQVEGHPHRFSEVLYVDASSVATLEVGLSSIALDKRLGDDWKEIVKWLVLTRERWLLVLDNADDAELDLRPFIPQCSHGNIVITTRNKQLRLYPGSCEISRMSQQDAKALFVRRSQLRNSEDDKINKLIIELIEELDFLALGIVQAAAYLQVNTTCTIERYLTMLRSDRRNVLEKSQNYVNRPDDYEKTVYTTWNISLERLGETHPESVTFLYICSFLHHKDISETMFVNAAISAPDYKHDATTLSHSAISWIQDFLRPFVDPTPDTSDAFHEIAAHLCAYSLVEVTLERNLSFHRLVHDWSRRCAITAGLDPNYSALILCLSFAPFTDLKAPDAIAYTRMLLPHMQGLQASLDKSLNAEIACNFQSVYHHHGWWWHAEQVGILAMETMRRVLGEEHLDTLTGMAWLASTYRYQGQWKEAEGLEVKVLEVRKRVLGEEHPDTLTCMANLASTYSSQGLSKEAEGLEVKVLEASKRVRGKEHPDTLTSIANLALTYRDQGRWKEAEGLGVKVLEASKRVLGEEHPDTLTSMANLAATYWNQGRWKEAEGLQVKVLEARKRVLGDEHSETLTSMANLALTYRYPGRWKEAEGLQVKVLEAMKRVLGDEHPDTLTSMGNLASMYWNQGRWKEAEGLEVKVLEARKRVLGDEHPDTLKSMGNLASTYWNQGRWKEAEGLQVKVLEAMKRVLGDEHPDTLASMANLASTYWSQGRWEKAERLQVKVFEARKRVLGEEHPDTLTSMAWLASTYREQGRWRESEALEGTLLGKRKRVLGEDHPDTLRSMVRLASIYRRQGRRIEADRLDAFVAERTARTHM